ncbi:hypothetical protein BD626DRAFT_564279 [Schizophyllum amplum]|uniref:F-box domain-containing protein n=1 Tax=Schizophyllum amplum TaxID=97359 RepID=A0A550CR74_9AGAR|nr:hypothetical protein BD626DRAFT_564279 [Auriculariopsis ampla]
MDRLDLDVLGVLLATVIAEDYAAERDRWRLVPEIPFRQPHLQICCGGSAPYSRVCKKWSRVLRDTPAVWQTILITLNESSHPEPSDALAMEAVLAKSGGLPLHVALRTRSSYHRPSSNNSCSVMSVLVAQAHRWTTLELDLTFLPSPAGIFASNSMLTSFSLVWGAQAARRCDAYDSFYAMGDETAVLALMDGLPLQACQSIDLQWLSWAHPTLIRRVIQRIAPAAPCLRRLSIDAHTFHVIDIILALQDACRLQFLRLRHTSYAYLAWDVDVDWDAASPLQAMASVPSLALPALCRLELIGGRETLWQFLSRLEMPILEDLTLRGTEESYHEDFWASRMVWSSTLAPLLHLRLVDVGLTENEMVILLQHQPRLDTLEDLAPGLSTTKPFGASWRSDSDIRSATTKARGLWPSCESTHVSAISMSP